MILPGEESKRDTAKGKQNGVGAKPKSVTRQSGETDCANHQQDNSCHQNQAKDMKRLQPWIDPIPENNKVLEALTECDYRGKNEEQFSNANEPRKKIQNAIHFGGKQRTLIFSANKNRDWPEENG